MGLDKGESGGNDELKYCRVRFLWGLKLALLLLMAVVVLQSTSMGTQNTQTQQQTYLYIRKNLLQFINLFKNNIT